MAMTWLNDLMDFFGGFLFLLFGFILFLLLTIFNTVKFLFFLADSFFEEVVMVMRASWITYADYMMHGHYPSDVYQQKYDHLMPIIRAMSPLFIVILSPAHLTRKCLKRILKLTILTLLGLALVINFILLVLGESLLVIAEYIRDSYHSPGTVIGIFLECLIIWYQNNFQ